ncbi:MAG: alpha/beta hydrolase [Angustibacter sp.]
MPRRYAPVSLVAGLAVIGVGLSTQAYASTPLPTSVMATSSGATSSGATSSGATSSGATSSGATGQIDPIDWRPCRDPRLRDLQCGSLDVPLDHDDLGGPTITLALSRARHTVPDADYQGVMLTNPGGPGGSGLGLARLGDVVPKQAGGAYDWIGFDPRGVGASEPALSCQPNYARANRPDYRPRNRAIETNWLTRTARYASACGQAGGALLDHLSTIDVARDVDLIRQALGQQRINYFGFSYGTYLGQVYATMFPSRVRRMVFDGTINPERVWYQANLDQNLAFDLVANRFFDWVARHDATYRLGRDRREVRRQWYDQLDHLAQSPAGGRIGPAEWSDLFVGAGYAQAAWPATAALFSAWVNDGDAQALVDAYGSAGSDNGYAMYLAVQCTDAPWPPRWSTWRADAVRQARTAPFLTWANTWYNAPCLTWPAKAGVPVNIDGRRVPPILMINQTLDAATPYPGSLEVRDRFPRARLIAEPGGTTHSGSLSGNACVDNRIADYLATGRLPARRPGIGPDVRCRPLPEPKPATAARDATTPPAATTRTRLSGLTGHLAR